jgi:hypothetical protein
MLSLADGLTRDPSMTFGLRLVVGLLVGFQMFRVMLFLAEKYVNWSRPWKY